jgi:hypothetical protein
MLPIRDDQPRYSTPYVNAFLIALNVLVFLFELLLGPRELRAFFNQFALVPAYIWNPHNSLPQVIVPFFTAMFLHQGWQHILGNMWFLFLFGDNVEDYLGHFKYLVFYLLAGLLADAAQIAIYPQSHIGMVGASGAIAGVLGAYFLLYPRARVLTWFFVFVIYLPAWIVLGEWFVIQFFQGAAALSAAARKDVGGVAFWAHVGGFVSGLILVKLFGERARRYPYAYR